MFRAHDHQLFCTGLVFFVQHHAPGSPKNWCPAGSGWDPWQGLDGLQAAQSPNKLIELTLTITTAVTITIQIAQIWHLIIQNKDFYFYVVAHITITIKMTLMITITINITI